MGSGSFGNGTGAFGGGTGGGATRSAHERILDLSNLTKAINKNPALATLLPKLQALLQNNARGDFLKAALNDEMVLGPYRRLLSLQRRLQAGENVAQACSKEGAAGSDSLNSFVERICDRSSSPDTDEKIDNMARLAATDVLLRTVGNDADTYDNVPIASLRSKFDPRPLANTADIYLAKLIGETVTNDLLTLEPKARVAIGEASRQIAKSWVDKIRDSRKAVRMENVFGAIAEGYKSVTSGGSDE